MKTYPKPSVEKRAELYLGAVIRGFKGELTGSFDGQAKAMRVASWSTNGNDCIALAHYLAEQGALQQDKNQAQVFHLVAKGHLLWEKMAERRASSSQAFVAMWFDAQTLDAYTNGIGPAVVASGHEPLRIDGQQHVDKIDDRIIAEIRRSRFVVADFTGHRGGVYYEAGFAHGLGLRVIFTCRKDHFEKMHFDTRQYNTILWTNTSELRVELQNRILAIFGAGPHKPAAKSLPTTDYQ